MRKDVLKQACIYRKCVYLRKPVPRFRQDAPTPNNGASPPTNGVPGGPVNKAPSTPPRKSSNNNNTCNNNNNNNSINGVAGSTPALSNCSSNSNGSSHNNNSATNGSNNTSSGTTNHIGGGASNGGSSNNSSANNNNGSSLTPLHHSAPSATGTAELSSCRLNQSPFGSNTPGTNGVILDPLRHRSMMDAHYQHHRAPGSAPSFFDPMAAQLPSTGSPHHPHQHDLTPAAAAAAAVAAAAAAGNSMSTHHPVPHLNAHSQATKMVSPSSSSIGATSREAAAAATTYFPHPAESWGSTVPYAAFPRAPSWAASAYGFQQHSSPFASSFTPSSFPPSPFPGSSCRLSLPDSGSSSSSAASRYGPGAATSPQHPFHHTMTGISGFSTGDALSHAQYSHHPAHPHAHSNMRSSFYPPTAPSGHHLSSSSSLSSFPGLAPPSFGPSPYHPHPHSHMYPGSFYSSLRAATEPQIYHVRALPSQNPFKLLLQQTSDLLDSLGGDKSEMKPLQKDFIPHISDTSGITKNLSLSEINNPINDAEVSVSTDSYETFSTVVHRHLSQTFQCKKYQEHAVTGKIVVCPFRHTELLMSTDNVNEKIPRCNGTKNSHIPLASKSENSKTPPQEQTCSNFSNISETFEQCETSMALLEGDEFYEKDEEEGCDADGNLKIGSDEAAESSVQMENDTASITLQADQNGDGVFEDSTEEFKIIEKSHQRVRDSAGDSMDSRIIVNRVDDQRTGIMCQVMESSTVTTFVPLPASWPPLTVSPPSPSSSSLSPSSSFPESSSISRQLTFATSSSTSSLSSSSSCPPQSSS